MTNNETIHSVISRHVNSAFTIKLSVHSLFEEIYQGHIGSPNQTKRIVRQTTWINCELNHMKAFLDIASSQNPHDFSIVLLEKSVAKMILDFNKLGMIANRMALSRIRQKDSTKEYNHVRILMNSVVHSSSQLYDELLSLKTRQCSKAGMN
jgi:hypothetical protein